MNKKIFIIFLILFAIGATTWYFIATNSNKDDNSYQVERTEANSNTQNNTASNSTPLNTVNETKNTPPPTPVEKEISSFSTKIHNKDSARQNNITITCSTLNGTEVTPGSTFSFCDTVGKATSAKGYQKADIFTADGKKTKGLGGGNCQISTTLYNAVLAVPSLQVTERHEHSNYVPYIQRGKDAAVAYGGYDFKFVNNTKNKIKIQAQNTESEVIIKLIQIS